MKYVDSHAHVNFNAYRDDWRRVVEDSLLNEVGIINVGTNFSTSLRAVELAENYKEGVWAAIGTHPLNLNKSVRRAVDDKELPMIEAEEQTEEIDYDKYLELGKRASVVAIGEVGLDYHHFESGDNVAVLMARQKEALIGFINLANKLNKPVALHCWDAYSDLLEILKNHEVKKGGVVHSFIGGHKTAKKFIDLGFKIGINGVVTYADSFDRLIKELPLDSLLLETDAPYLTPGDKKGSRNEPIHVIETARHISSIKHIDEDVLRLAALDNTKKLFGL
jgi:TatD DNase family protein